MGKEVTKAIRAEGFANLPQINKPFRVSVIQFYEDPELEFLFTTEKDLTKTDPSAWLEGEIETIDEIHQRINHALTDLNKKQITRLKKRLKELQNGDKTS